MKKKLLCILLTLCMCIGLLPMTAVADTQEGGTDTEITEVTVEIGAAPMTDNSPGTVSLTVTNSTTGVAAGAVTWYKVEDGSDTVFTDSFFAGNTIYKAKMTLTPDTGYKWGENVTVKVSGAADGVTHELGDADSTGARELTLTFPQTAGTSIPGTGTDEITDVTLSGIAAPETGVAPVTTAPTVAESSKVSASNITWYEGKSTTAFTGTTFAANTVYTAKVTLTPLGKSNWYIDFAANSVTINGLPEGATKTLGDADATTKERVLTIVFPATAKGVMKGSVSISGEAKFGEKLTAAASNTPADAVLKYQWCRGNDMDGYTAISNATSSTYTLTADDIDKRIKVKVSADGYSGNIESAATAVVQRVDPTKDDFSIGGLIMIYGNLSNFYSAITSVVTKINNNIGEMTVSVWDSDGQEVTTVKDAGTYTVKVSTDESDTHNEAIYLEIGTVEVNKRTADYSQFRNFDAPNLTYNGTNQIDAIKDDVQLQNGVTGLEYDVFVSQTADTNLTTNATDATDATDAADYTVYVKVLGTSKNFNATTEYDIPIWLGTVTINKATLNDTNKDTFLTFTAPTGLTYNGENQIEAIEDAVTLKNGISGLDYEVYVSDADGKTSLTQDAISANTYEVYVKAKDTSTNFNATAADSDGIKLGTVTIGKATPTASFAKATVKVAKDGTVSNALTITPSSLTATYSSSKADVAEVDSTSGEVTLVAEGTTTITATIAGNDNYNGTTATYELTVLPEGTAIYTININAGTGGTVSTAGGEYASTETVSVTATPNTGYKFVKWTAAEPGSATTTDVSTNAAYSFTPDKNLNLTAHFEVISGGSGSGGGSSSGGSGSSSSGGGSSASSKTETSTNNDGSTTTTTTDKNGTVTEKTEHTDGTITTVETKKDGTVTEKTESTDGTIVTVETQTDGTTTTTEENADGSKRETTEQADGSVSIHETAADGTEVRTTITESGKTTATVSLPENTESKTVTIPTNTTPTAGTVVVVVHEDGTKEVVKTSVADGNGVAANLPNGATVEVVDMAKAFSDVNTSDWFKNAIDFVSARGLMNGVDGNSFGFDAPLTRGMLAQILHNLEGNPAHNGEKDFHDVGDTWYTDAVRWAAENSIVSGYTDGSYGPNDPITREQLATILYRYAQMKGYDVSAGEDTSMDSFSDSGNASNYALNALQWAYGDNIVSGNTDGTLNPTGEAERAQVAQMLMNFLVNTAMK